MATTTKNKKKESSWTLDRAEIIRDYRVAFQSRQASLLGRREVLTGKAKFGIFGDGKEVPQLAMARAFRNGDFRSGYYRDQTFMFATGMSDVQQFFAQLYAHTDAEAEPASAGRSMNGHFGTRSLNPDGSWKTLTDMPNSSADVSPTGSQMPRLVGLAYASKLYRELEELKSLTQFSRNGDEVAFGTIGNASCAEGMFWESVNAIGVLKSPAVISIWDDGYGISVPSKFQVTKADVGELLRGFQRKPETDEGYDIYVVRAWDYPALVETYLKAADTARRDHVPAIIHVVEVTQPQGHSTSGSHERYKSPERLEWEREHDCVKKMREWMIASGIATAEEIDAMEEEEKTAVMEMKERAWNAYTAPIQAAIQTVVALIGNVAEGAAEAGAIKSIADELTSLREPFFMDAVSAAARVLILTRNAPPRPEPPCRMETPTGRGGARFLRSHLHSQSAQSAMNIPAVAPQFGPDSPMKNGSEVLNACFDAALARDPRVIAFGEDLGQLGDVNQGFAGLQAKYGALRVSDTGIRECTILGQAIGMAMRGLRPIAEIQYLDYILYALQLMSDDLATVQWRTKGGQKAPVIIRTRGHRLEGVWHAGSPMAGILHLIRGIHLLVPRNMTQAAGFYNTLLQSDEPALVVEVLNGYRLKEQLPDNIGEFTLPLGVPEILREGTDVTIVTYGACCRVALDAAELLQSAEISAEVIDVQSLLPFDRNGMIVQSLKKTNRILFLDEDVPGGASAYMMQQVIEGQEGYRWLDSQPRTLAAAPHRPAYGSDGAYWSKPNPETVFEAVYAIMNEADPKRWPGLYR
ncbi:MAG: 2-oxoisovalerate dehydrogenase E1 component [Chlorobi bacterium OLB7]|nr:MAG: 2-oxoisovalerate dehydrogenase E1 component [Chlorobi bacterium OLB7]